MPDLPPPAPDAKTDTPPPGRSAVVIPDPPARTPSLRFLLLGVLLPTGFVGMLLVGQGTWPAIFGAASLVLLFLLPAYLWRRGSGRKALAVAVGSAILILPLAAISGWQHCYACGTGSTYSDLAWGVHGDWIRFRVADRLRPTLALEDWFPADHGHTWFMSHEYKWGVLMFNTPVSGGYKACASPYMNPFGWSYQNDPAFRDLLREKVRAGEVTPEQVRTLFSLRRRRLRGIGATDAESAALARLAGPWIGEPNWHTWWEPGAR